jgi:hypothetical protein
MLNNPLLWIAVAGIAGVAIIAAAFIVASSISQNTPAAPAPQTAGTPLVVTREITREVSVAAATLTAQPTYTPWATYTPFPTATPLPTFTPAPTATPLPPPRWSELGKLASVEYTAQTVVERERNRPGVGNVLLGKDRIVLLAAGRVMMGIDLEKIRPSDMAMSGDAITVTLPAIELLAVELLPDQSRIFDSQRSWIFSEYQGLELEAMNEARRKLREEASRNSQMIRIAESQARLQVIEFLRKAGFQNVTVKFKTK